MQYFSSGFGLSRAINSVYSPVSTVCKQALHVPVEMYPLQLPVFFWLCMHSHTYTKYVG